MMHHTPLPVLDCIPNVLLYEGFATCSTSSDVDRR